MNREQIIETMARGIDPYAWDADTIGETARHSCRAKAERCLSALEAAGLVVVPVVPTPAMMGAGGEEHRNNPTSSIPSIYTAMIKAAQEDKP